MQIFLSREMYRNIFLKKVSINIILATFSVYSRKKGLPGKGKKGHGERRKSALKKDKKNANHA